MKIRYLLLLVILALVIACTKNESVASKSKSNIDSVMVDSIARDVTAKQIVVDTTAKAK